MADKPKRPTLVEELLPIYRGIVESEGCRRLSVALGGVCELVMVSVYWFFFSTTNLQPNWDSVAFSLALAFWSRGV